MLQEVGISESEFESYIKEMKTYRDKFVAHLDSDNAAHIPRLEIAHISASYLYDYLLDHEEINNCFNDAPTSSKKFYTSFLNEGKLEYQ